MKHDASVSYWFVAFLFSIRLVLLTTEDAVIQVYSEWHESW